jgi:hypothetical protein
LLFLQFKKAVQSILYRDNNAKATHFCISLATLNSFTLLTVTYAAQQYQVNSLLLSHGKNVYTNAPQCFIIHTLPVLLHSTSGVKCFSEHNFFIDALNSNHLVPKGEVVGSWKHSNGAAVCQSMWATS